MKTHVKLYTLVKGLEVKLYNSVFPNQCSKKLTNERILNDYQCIFIHIPKTGGMTITRALNRLPTKIERIQWKPVKLKHVQHAKAREIKRTVGDQIWSTYFTFAFVRNPWDLMVSCYHWWLQKAHKWNRFHKDIENIKRMSNFNHFMHSQYGKTMINECKGNMFDWISERGELSVDFVGQFENLQTDWDWVCEQIGVSPQPLPHLNQSKHKNYQTYYTLDTQQIVYERFKEEIERFHYSF